MEKREEKKKWRKNEERYGTKKESEYVSRALTGIGQIGMKKTLLQSYIDDFLRI